MAMILLLIVTGAAFSLVNPGTVASQAQPEAMDMQQRARIGSDLLFRDLFMAGAGVYLGPKSGALTNYFAPIIPRKMGFQNPDAWNVARTDAVTISYIPNTYSQTTIRDPMPLPSSELKVEDMPNCPKGEPLCGFKDGMTLLIFDEEGHWDFFTVTNVQDEAGHLNHHQQDLSYAYQPGAVVTQAESHMYYYDAANRQLRHYDGYQTDVPVVDNVVGVRFDYYGDPLPPTRPKPSLGVANCLYSTTGTYIAGMPTLTTQGGSLAELPISILNDGPWCGNNANRFDADLLRVKKVKVTLRVQASQAQFRGSGADFAVAGTNNSAIKSLPDYTVTFEVTPRNINLGR
jgi:hypothetical protein